MPLCNRGDVFIDEAIGLDAGGREPFEFEFAELSAPQEERAEQPSERRARVAVALAPVSEIGCEPRERRGIHVVPAPRETEHEY